MLLELDQNGLYCAAGDFYIDPWNPVPRAVITHAHADHARSGSGHYLIAATGMHVARWRLGSAASLQPEPFGKPLLHNGVEISFHPAGHILGAAQIRVAHKGEVWVVSGDYKAGPDPTCTAFEPVACNTFITEATFGLPIYRWPRQQQVFEEINAWWRQNQQARRASILFAYALGKAQRVLAGIDASIGPLFVHGAVHQMNKMYLKSGIALPKAHYVSEAPAQTDWSQSLIIAPTSARSSPWIRRFGAQSTAFASGWMHVRGQRRRRSVDRGFVLSDHVDWPDLMDAVDATGAERVLVTHGQVATVARYLREEKNLDARALETPFSSTMQADESADAPEDAGAEDTP